MLKCCLFRETIYQAGTWLLTWNTLWLYKPFSAVHSEFTRRCRLSLCPNRRQRWNIRTHSHCKQQYQSRVSRAKQKSVMLQLLTLLGKMKKYWYYSWCWICSSYAVNPPTALLEPPPRVWVRNLRWVGWGRYGDPSLEHGTPVPLLSSGSRRGSVGCWD